MTGANSTSHVDTIITLAQEIAQLAPEWADKALKIIDAARELGDRPWGSAVVCRLCRSAGC